MSVVEAEATARRLTPLASISTVSEAGTRSTKQLELVELLGLPDVRDLDFDLAWRPRLERDRLRVPIGQDTQAPPSCSTSRNPPSRAWARTAS